MQDIDIVVANNIIEQMKKHNTKQIDLANAIHVSKQIMSKMLNGTRLISIAELHKIADFFHITMDDLLKTPTESAEVDVMRAFMGKVGSEEAREALRTADKLADMIIFHANVRENAKVMSEKWEM